MTTPLIKSKNIKKTKHYNIKSQPPSQIIVGRTWRVLDHSLVNYLFDAARSINVKYLMIALLFVIINTFLIANSLEQGTVRNFMEDTISQEENNEMNDDEVIEEEENSEMNDGEVIEVQKQEIITISGKEKITENDSELQRQKKVEQFILENTEHLEKVCSGEIGERFIWTAPIEGSKTLEFSKFADEDELGWKVTKVDGEDVFEFNQPSTLYFTKKFKDKVITLDYLMPTYPAISGVDFLQVVVTLCYVCKQQLSLFDISDLSTPYDLLYAKNYYEYTINGPFPLNEKYKEKSFNEETFLECTRDQLKKISYKGRTFKTYIYEKIQNNLEACSEQDLDVQKCPLGYRTIGVFLYTIIFPQCVTENIGDDYVSDTLTFEFKELKSLYTLMTKLPPSSPPTSVIDLSKCPEVPNYDTLKSHLSEDKIETSIQDSFKFCFTQVTNEKITGGLILKKVMRCVSQNLDFLWKHQCEKNFQ